MSESPSVCHRAVPYFEFGSVLMSECVQISLFVYTGRRYLMCSTLWKKFTSQCLVCIYQEAYFLLLCHLVWDTSCSPWVYGPSSSSGRVPMRSPDIVLVSNAILPSKVLSPFLGLCKNLLFSCPKMLSDDNTKLKTHPFSNRLLVHKILAWHLLPA